MTGQKLLLELLKEKTEEEVLNGIENGEIILDLEKERKIIDNILKYIYKEKFKKTLDYINKLNKMY